MVKKKQTSAESLEILIKNNLHLFSDNTTQKLEHLSTKELETKILNYYLKQTEKFQRLFEVYTLGLNNVKTELTKRELQQQKINNLAKTTSIIIEEEINIENKLKIKKVKKTKNNIDII